MRDYMNTEKCIIKLEKVHFGAISLIKKIS